MYRGRIEKDFNVWVTKGLVGKDAASAMLAEYDARETVFSAGRVLTLLAALLLSAAILLLIAANWEAIPRLVRVCGLVAMIWAFYLTIRPQAGSCSTATRTTACPPPAAGRC